MVAYKNASAPIHRTQNWTQIPWKECQKSVRKLQVRIVKAVQEERWNKVKCLQHLITRGFSAKALAVKHVTSNKGKRTAGIDGELWLHPSICYKAIRSLKQRGYKPLSLRRIYIPKADGKKRPLSIPAIKDRAMQALYLYALDPVSETLADKNSYGFRKERSTADAIGQVYNVLTGRNRANWILECDIANCFDSISHDWLLSNIPMETKILQGWLEAGFIYREDLTKTEMGAPQGAIISPTLANMALDGLELRIKEAFGSPGTYKRKQSKVHLIRYADDCIVTGVSKEILEAKVRPMVEAFLSERGLKLHDTKTKITHIEEGVDFLGQNIGKYKGKVIIKPSTTSLKAVLSKVRYMIKYNMSSSQEDLITRLNPVIRGWANYHRHICARKSFEKIDHEIFTILWRWAKRRHAQKGAKWVKEKYFQRIGKRDWLFGCKESEIGTKPKKLVYATDIRIQRHIKIRQEANPYDPAWKVYFEDLKMYRTAKGMRGKAKALWEHQQGICTICRSRIEDPQSWKIINYMRGEEAHSTLAHKECKQDMPLITNTNSRSLNTRGFKQLEPYDGKLSRTVLRGGGICT